jgi:DNA-directed RNA polymerase II subunit RPB1
MATSMDNKKAAKIIGIQFSILSPEEIRNGSVAEITNRDTYINNKPIIGGLFDPRMGVLDPGLICPTDGLDYMNTPGYFGHINLARPVYYIQYLNTLIKIIRCTCIKCGKLLIDKNKYNYALKMKDDERWNFVFSLASKVKRCGEDTHDGCGCKQPSKIKKEGLATLIAEWDNVDGLSSEDVDKLSVKLLPENVLKNMKRISDEDISFMGFSPIWSRPEWMICQVLAVPPPAVRPSVKHDSQQRSEDDISHIIVNIIKANKTLQDKITQNANSNVIDDWSTVLQYYCATLVDNKIPGVASVAQRSGRPLKSIKERLNGKAGRVRGNLMGKRVDYSARSVITPDPQLSIRELGVPLKIAKNLTKPVIVNNKNKLSLLKLVQNGPDNYPGAKILERKNGENISLRYIDRNSIRLENGDRVHRHMMDGDAILFNRQPTLHRMSMMCHIVKVLFQGDTFRMNVADTKPYNADFDGDEMNLHMPQDEEAEIELRNLAAVPYQIISPANNKTIIGIFQDSLLGCYQFTRKNILFNPRETMNLLMSFDKIDLDKLDFSKPVSSFDILSQIMLPLSLKYKTKKFSEGEDFKDSNNVLEINNGKYIRGQIEKGVLGDGTKGLLQRITKDFGYLKGSNFIDNLQNIITDYMKSTAFSVGISDLVANKITIDLIAESITSKKAEVKSLMDEIHLGIFENKTGKTNEEAFETQVNNILNKASMEAGNGSW